MTRRARDVLIDILRDEGITHVFGNPGSTEMPLMDALVDAPDITYVLGLQEAAAVAMADGWALASGRVGFVNLHAMGGLGNAMGVLVASKASETPLVVTAGQQDTRHLMTEPWLSGDLVALASPVVIWARELRRGEDVGLGRSRRARRSRLEMGEGGAAGRGCRPGAQARLRRRPHPALRSSFPVAADGRSR
jgi:benzoylformate decarboxylase